MSRRPAVTMRDRPRIVRQRVKVDGRTVVENVTVYPTRSPWWRRVDPYALWAVLCGLAMAASAALVIFGQA